MLTAQSDQEMTISYSAVSPLPESHDESVQETEFNVSFTRSDFDDSQFSPIAFLADKRHLPLDQLRFDLIQLSKTLKLELVELINHDYAQFISLSSNLVGLDTMILTLREPLSLIQSNVSSVKDAISSRIEKLEDLLSKRVSVRSRKAEVESLIRIHESLEKVESLLTTTRSPNGQHHPRQDDTEEEESQGSVHDPELIERVATEYNNLQFAVSKAQHLKQVHDLKPRIEQMKQTVKQTLAQNLRRLYKMVSSQTSDGFASDPSQSLLQTLRIFVLIDKVLDAELIFDETVLTPFINSTIDRSALDTEDGLQKLTNRILSFVEQNCLTVCRVAETAFKSTTYDLYMDVVTSRLLNSMMQNLPFLFNAGNPSTFHTNYHLFQKFIRGLERLSPSTSSVERMSSTQAYIDLSKKWQLNVYFQIRHNDIVTDLEMALESGAGFSSSETPEYGVRTKAVLGVISCLTRAWDANVYMEPLSLRFVKLSLMILERFFVWAREAVQKLDMLSQQKTADPSSQGVSQIAVAEEGHDQNGSTTPAAGMDIARILDFHHDLSKFKSIVLNLCDALMIPRLSLDETRQSHVKNFLTARLDTVTTLLPDIMSTIVTGIVSECIQVLVNVRNIPGQYRRTNRPVPTKPSYFVPAILAPLKTFIETHCAGLEKEVLIEWKKAVIDLVTKEYASRVQELVASVKATEQSLKRLRKAKKTTANEGDTVSDEEKIHIQIRLDIDYYKEEVSEKMGVPLSTMEGTFSLLVVPVESNETTTSQGALDS